MNNITLILICLGLLLILSAFFSAAEMAFSSLNRIKLKNIAASGNKKARLALKLAEHYDSLLSTVLIGNNIVNIASSALCTVLMVGMFGGAGVTVATAIMTIVILLFGEISPKTLAKEAPERIAVAIAPTLRLFMIILTPISYLAILWKKLVIGFFHVKSNRAITEAELLTFVEEARQDGGINEREESMIRRTIEFDELTAGDIFTPRIDIAAVTVTDSAALIEKKFRDTGFSRLPVYQDTIDQITGVVLLKDFFGATKPLADIIKPVLFITKTLKIARLLKLLQERKMHIAVLVDEFGGTVGMVTVEDIVEELVGEIWDEHDNIVEPVLKIADGIYRIQGSVSLVSIQELFPGAVPADDDSRTTTVAGWVLEQAGGVPKEGDTFNLTTALLTVSKVVHHRVVELTVRAL
jgi:CBS domain containing-hemolysin-like protein